MSRTLSKILIICAMVVLFPLMIIGTAFATYYSINANVLVSTFVNVASMSDDAYAHVVYNNKADISFDITQSHLSKVSLNATAKGYNFIGWFLGDAEAYSVAKETDKVEYVSESAELTFDIVDYSELLAVFEIQTYNNVSYSYESTPNGEIVTVVPEGGKTVYNYGDTLPTLTYAGLDYTFKGWTVKDGDGTVYTTATFEKTSDIVLEAVWEPTKEVTVTYYDGETLLGSPEQILVNQEYILTDPLTLIEAENGYDYSWMTADGTSITELNNQATDINIYLKKEAIVYTVNVNLTDAKFDGTTPSVTFTVEDNTNLNAWIDSERWSTDYSYNEVSGLIYNTVHYNFAGVSDLNSLAQAIVTDNPRGENRTITVDVEIDTNFANFEVEGAISGILLGTETPVYASEGDLPNDGIGGSPLKLTGRSGSSSLTLNDMLNLTANDGKAYAYDADLGNGYEVSLARLGVTIRVGGEETTLFVDVDGNMKVADVINAVYEEYSSISLAETFTFVKIIALFA